MKWSELKICNEYVRCIILIVFFSQYIELNADTPDTINKVELKLSDSITPNSNLDFTRGMNLGADVAELQKAQVALDNAIEYGELLNKIGSGTWLSLPMKSTFKQKNLKVVIAVNKLSIQTNFSEIEAYVSIELPKGKKLLFGAPSLKLNSTGGLVGETRLALLSDYAIDLGANKSVLVLKRAVTGSYGGTYVSIDCDGFKSLSLDAEIVFSRDVVVPTDIAGHLLPSEYVRGRFTATVSDWNDILAEISLPNFAIPDYSDLAFSLNSAVIDLSDLKNSPSVKFPDAYEGEVDVLWRGVYVQSLKAILPPQIKKRGQSERIQASVYNLIIDNTGASGSFATSNVLDINSGAMNKWAYSLDTLQANIIQNQLVGFGFGGLIRPPIIDEIDQGGIEYAAFMDGNHNFKLSASIPKAVKFRFLQAAKVSIKNNSTIELSVRKDDFYPSAILHGSMEISASLSSESDLDDTSNTKGLKLARMDFEGMKINPDPSYLELGVTSFTTGKLANFPIQVHKLSFQAAGSNSAIYADINLNLMEESAGAFNLRTAFRINSNLQDNEIQQWKFNNFKLDAISLNMDIGPVKLVGSLAIYENDPDYATGFCGNVDATFSISKSHNVNAKAAVIFGRTNDFRYWFADALVEGLSIPIAPVTKITGFGGGAFRKMKMVSRGSGTGGIACVSTSGMKYVPDGNQGLGIRAAILLAASKPSLFTAQATFELNFNATGGLGQAGIYGNGQFLVNTDFNLPSAQVLSDRLDKMAGKISKDLQSEDKKTAVNGTEAVSFQLLVDLNFNEDIYKGAFSLYVDVAKGKLKGNASPPPLAGAVDLYFSKDIWHIYLGTYSSRLSLLTTIAKAELSAGVYFMAGNDLLPAPVLDSKIVNELKISPDQLNKDRVAYDANLKSGSGFALGANLHFIYDNNGKKFKIRVSAGAGFEFCLLDLGPNASCVNGFSPIGANGWRANGMIYLYANVTVKYLGIGASPGLALMLRGEMPNPNYFQAYIRVLSMKISFDIGEPCF